MKIMPGKSVHEDTPEEAAIRRNISVLISIGVPGTKIAKGSGIDVNHYYAFTLGRSNLNAVEIDKMLKYFTKIKNYLRRMLV